MDTTIPVTLIVKASNQQFEDQTIICELSWTIRKLKGYLTEVYPSRPATEEQKLIYSGQLLNDTVTLKDVLRQYDGQETHTVHLVFTPKHNNYYSSTKKMPSPKNTESVTATSSTGSDRVDGLGDGLRQRNTVNNATTPASNTQINPTNISANMFYNIPGMTPAATVTANPNDFLMAQNLAMQNLMQQAYIQYINQYMNLMSSGQVSPEALYATVNQQTNPLPENVNQHTAIPAAYYPFYQQMPSAPSIPTLTPLIASSQPTPQSSSSSQTQNPQPETPPPQNPDNVAPAPQNDQPAAQRRFPNIVEQEQENRDWLDFFFSLCRVLVLLGVVYLYSSPTRCFVVIIIGILLYLYQIGFFRNQQVDNMELARRRVVREINAIANANVQHNPNNNNNNDNNNNERPEQAPEAPERPEEAENSANENSDNTEMTPLVSNEANRTNINDVAGFVRTLVLSFFTSIIPDTPAS